VDFVELCVGGRVGPGGRTRLWCGRWRRKLWRTLLCWLPHLRFLLLFLLLLHCSKHARRQRRRLDGRARPIHLFRHLDARLPRVRRHSAGKNSLSARPTFFRRISTFRKGVRLRTVVCALIPVSGVSYSDVEGSSRYAEGAAADAAHASRDSLPTAVGVGAFVPADRLNRFGRASPSGACAAYPLSRRVGRCRCRLARAGVLLHVFSAEHPAATGT
jgi:hypothetical protein